MPVTLKDIADRAGVSITTVSRVLNKRESAVQIREETRQRIFSIAEELKYRPNSIARALRANHSFLLGVLAQNIASLFHSQIIVGLNEAAVEHGYRVFLGHVQRTVDIALDYGSMFEQSHADGILIIGELSGNLEAFDALARQYRYIVSISDRLSDHNFPGVYSDSAFGAQLAMDHLWELGHRRIVCMTDTSLQEGKLRAGAYQNYMYEHGAGDVAEIIVTARSFQASFETGQKFFAEHSGEQKPTAIFATTDSIAIGLLQAAFRSGVSIPDQLSIIGFDDIDFAAFTVPPLTTVRQSGVQMGHVGANLLIEMIEQERDSSTVQDVILTPTLIVRQSTDSITA
jgi:DNA-binding LacI/PurR family transcriptional regulator